MYCYCWWNCIPQMINTFNIALKFNLDLFSTYMEKFEMGFVEGYLLGFDKSKKDLMMYN